MPCRGMVLVCVLYTSQRILDCSSRWYIANRCGPVVVPWHPVVGRHEGLPSLLNGLIDIISIIILIAVCIVGS